jgi:hypothetical protein
MDAQVLSPDARNLRFLGYVGSGLFLVRLAAKDWGKVAFSVFAAVDQGLDMIQVPGISGIVLLA